MEMLPEGSDTPGSKPGLWRDAVDFLLQFLLCLGLVVAAKSTTRYFYKHDGAGNTSTKVDTDHVILSCHKDSVSVTHAENI